MRFLVRSLALFIAVTAWSLPGASAQSVVIVVHPDSEITSISRSELSKIFLKRLRVWSDGTKAEPVDLPPGSPTRAEFSRQVHDRSVVHIEVYWKRMIFSGRAVPPKELAEDRKVLEFVRANPGAVGYVSESAALEGVRRVSLKD